MGIDAERELFVRALGGNARFLAVKSDSKAPVSSFKKGRRNFRNLPPEHGNFGVIPQGRLIILDFDGADAQRQVDAMSRLLGARLRSSLAVISQSGGIHVYLTVPTRFAFTSSNFPKASLRKYSAVVAEMLGIDGFRLDADVRSPLVLGYVIAPTSCFGGEPYRIASTEDGFDCPDLSSSPILELPESSMSCFAEMVARFENGRNRKISKRRSLDAEERIPDSTETVHESEGVSRTSLSRLKSGLSRRAQDNGKDQSFHARRAFVKAALAARYDDEAIADACVALHIDRDTYTDSRISRRSLLEDLKGFVPNGARTYDGYYCGRGGRRGAQNLSEGAVGDSDGVSASSPSDGTGSPSEGLTEALERLRNRRVGRDVHSFRNRDPRVIDPSLVASRLRMGHRSETQQFRDAFAVFDHFIQPLSNVGAPRIILAMNALTSEHTINLTQSRARQALRLLRDAGIIILEERQRHGLAPTYSVPDSLIERTLSQALRGAWRASERIPEIEHRPLYFDRLRGVFREVFSNAVVPLSRHDRITGEVAIALDLMRQSSIKDTGFVSAGASRRFLAAEAAALGLRVEEDGTVVGEETGVPLPQRSPDLVSENPSEVFWNDGDDRAFSHGANESPPIEDEGSRIHLTSLSRPCMMET